MLYQPDDVDCTGLVFGVGRDDGIENGDTDGALFSRRYYRDITEYEFSCTAGVVDPLTSQFSSQYVVRA